MAGLGGEGGPWQVPARAEWESAALVSASERSPAPARALSRRPPPLPLLTLSHAPAAALRAGPCSSHPPPISLPCIRARTGTGIAHACAPVPVGPSVGRPETQGSCGAAAAEQRRREERLRELALPSLSSSPPTMEDVQLRRLHVETSVRPAAGPGGGWGAGGPGGAGLGRVGGRGGERARQAGRGAQSACFRRSRRPPPALSVRGTAARPARRRPPTRMQGQGQAPTSHSLGGDGLGPGPGPPRAAARGCGVNGLSRRPPRALSLTLSLPSTPSSQPRPPTSPPSPPASPAPR